jgi:transcriptional regulator with XRE-family HTH domain
MSIEHSRTVTGRALLAAILREGRFLTGESPEQVGTAVGIAGRTIRRLERGDLRSGPREITLEALAAYYAFDSSVLKWLASTAHVGDALLAAVTDRADASGISSAGRADEIALRLARALPAQVAANQPASEDEAELLREYRRLDPRRRRLAHALVLELRLAYSEERRRSEGAQQQEPTLSPLL